MGENTFDVRIVRRELQAAATIAVREIWAFFVILGEALFHSDIGFLL